LLRLRTPFRRAPATASKNPSCEYTGDCSSTPGTRWVAAAAGKLKTFPNFVEDPEFPEGLFGYTSPSSLADTMRHWREFALAADARTSELLRQLLSHWMFEHVHPVPDGNGRIGRLLVPIVMRLKGQTTMACTFFGEAVHEERRCISKP
jgi:hypothetical protein